MLRSFSPPPQLGVDIGSVFLTAFHFEVCFASDARRDHMDMRPHQALPKSKSSKQNSLHIVFPNRPPPVREEDGGITQVASLPKLCQFSHSCVEADTKEDTKGCIFGTQRKAAGCLRILPQAPRFFRWRCSTSNVGYKVDQQAKMRI